MTAILQQAVHW